MDPAIASPHAAGLCVGTFVTAKPYQDDVDVILGGMVLARGTAKIAISFSAGTLAVSVVDF